MFIIILSCLTEKCIKLFGIILCYISITLANNIDKDVIRNDCITEAPDSIYTTVVRLRIVYNGVQKRIFLNSGGVKS